MDILKLLSGKGFIMVNKELAKKTSLEASAIFGQLVSSYESFKSKNMLTIVDGKDFFFLTSEMIQEETTLKYNRQKTAIDLLEKKGYIKTKMLGVPAKKYYHITKKIIIELVEGNEILKNAVLDQIVEDLNETSENSDVQQTQNPSFVNFTNLGLSNSQSKDDENHNTIKKKKEKESVKKKKDNDLSINKRTRKTTRKEIIEEVRQQYEGLIDNKSFEIVVRRVIAEKPRRFRDYLRKSVENEIKSLSNQEQAATDENVEDRAQTDVIAERTQDREIFTYTAEQPKQMTDADLVKRQEAIKNKLLMMREQQKRMWKDEENY